MTRTKVTRCLVVDDDPMSRALLEEYVSRHEALELADSCADAVEAANRLRRKDVDLILLDIEMPEMSGIELAKDLGPETRVILVSGKSEYAVTAFDIEVVDYLLKPVSYGRFLRAIRRSLHRPDTEVTDPGASERGKYVFVKSDGKLVKVVLDSIQWIEAQGDYVLIHEEGRRIMMHGTMSKLAKKLPSDAFSRVHRSYIVRLDCIDDIEDSSVVIGRTVIPIGASYRQDFLNRLETL
jgi:DNA-binding LytR/AlgR family response regulator